MQMIKEQKIRKELRDNKKIEDCAKRFGVTGDKTRLKICYLLCYYPELSVSQIAGIIDAPISTVSHSLKKLRVIHVVENRRRTREVLYSLSNNQFATVIKNQLLEK